MALINGTPNSDPALVGTDFNDTIYGLEGHDSLFGEAGDDQLFGGLGADALFGGAGYDFLASGTDNLDTRLDGGDGIDLAKFEGTFEQFTFTLTSAGLYVDQLDADTTASMFNTVLLGDQSAPEIEFLQFDDITVRTLDLLDALTSGGNSAALSGSDARFDELANYVLEPLYRSDPSLSSVEEQSLGFRTEGFHLQGEDGTADVFVADPSFAARATLQEANGGFLITGEKDTIVGFEQGIDRLDLSALGAASLDDVYVNVDGDITKIVVTDPSTGFSSRYEVIDAQLDPNDASQFIFAEDQAPTSPPAVGPNPVDDTLARDTLVGSLDQANAFHMLLDGQKDDIVNFNATTDVIDLSEWGLSDFEQDVAPFLFQDGEHAKLVIDQLNGTPIVPTEILELRGMSIDQLTEANFVLASDPPPALAGSEIFDGIGRNVLTATTGADTFVMRGDDPGPGKDDILGFDPDGDTLNLADYELTGADDSRILNAFNDDGQFKIQIETISGAVDVIELRDIGSASLSLEDFDYSTEIAFPDDALFTGANAVLDSSIQDDALLSSAAAFADPIPSELVDPLSDNDQAFDIGIL